MTEPDPLDESDARALIRLLGEIATIDRGHAAQKSCLMDGLCQLIGAHCWAWSLACHYMTEPAPVYVALNHGGFSQARFARLLLALDHPDMPAINAGLINEFRRHRRHLTRLRDQIDIHDRFLHSPAFDLRKAAGIEHVIMSIYPLDAVSDSMSALYRPPGAAPFTAREARLVHLLLGAVPWLHAQGWPADRGVSVPALSQRQRLALNFLLEGRSRKQIAEHLGLSIHTIHGYIKVLYRHFRVQSHPELIARFRAAAGSDRRG